MWDRGWVVRARASPGSPLGCSWPCWYTSQQHSLGLQDQSKPIWRRVSCVILGVGDPSLGPLPGRPFISSSARPFTQLLPGSSRGRGSLGKDLTLDEAVEGASHWLQTLVPFWLRPVKASPCSSISFWFPTLANVRQQVGCSQNIFRSPPERARFLRFCAMLHWPQRVCAGHAWVRGSVALVARWPASSRGALGSRGPGHPSSSPRRGPATWAARLSSMWAGGRAGGRERPPPAGPLGPQALTRSAPAGGR